MVASLKPVGRDDECQTREQLILGFALQRGVLVPSEQDTLDDSLSRYVSSQISSVCEAGGQTAVLASGVGEGGRGVTQRGRVKFTRIADTNGHHRKPRRTRQHQSLADCPRETARLKAGAVDP